MCAVVVAGTALATGTDCEQLLTDSVDFGEGASPTGDPPTVPVPSGSLACLPEASDLPSPDDVPVRKSDWNVLESREWYNAAEDERPVTAPQFNAGSCHGRPLSSPVIADTPAEAQPFTSNFDGHAALASACF